MLRLYHRWSRGLTTRSQLGLLLASLLVANSIVFLAKRKSETGIVKEEAEEDIWDRILHPDMEASLLFGVAPAGRPAAPLVVGIASRGKADDGLAATLDAIVDRTTGEERALLAVVAGLFGPDPSTGATALGQKYKAELESGFLRVVAPPGVIHPSLPEGGMGTYGDGLPMTPQDARLTLDAAFLASYCGRLSPAGLYLNMEGGTDPAPGFVSAAFRFAEERDSAAPGWTSLRLSGHLSSGRLYRSADLGGLAAFLLSSYRSQPLGYLMHYFDLLRQADGFGTGEQFRRKKPLFRHPAPAAGKTRKRPRNRTSWSEELRRANPEAKLLTTLKPRKGRRLESAYRPGSSAFFWGTAMRTGAGGAGDTIDIMFALGRVHPRRFLLLTGLPPGARQQERPRDRLKRAALLGSPEAVGVAPDGLTANCRGFAPLVGAEAAAADANGTLDFRGPFLDGGLECLRVRLLETESDSLAVRLVAVEADPYPTTTAAASVAANAADEDADESEEQEDGEEGGGIWSRGGDFPRVSAKSRRSTEKETTHS